MSVIVLPLGFTRDELVECAEREVRMRVRAYARFVELGKMSSKKAQEETAAMRAIVAVLQQLPATPPAQPGLFGDGGRKG